METIEYFKELAPDYDEKNKKKFWKLCDELLWDLTKESISKLNLKKIKLLDAGGGTGFWTNKLLREFNNLEIELCDISDEMLKVARNKTEKFKYKLNIRKCSIENLPYQNEEFDVVINYYVLPFVRDEKKALKELSRVTKRKGMILIVFENIYHGMSLNLLCNKVNRVDELLDGNAVKIADHIPKLNFNSFSQIKEMFDENNLGIIGGNGFPVISNVGVREKITGNNYSISDVLKSDDNFNRVLEIEKKLIRKEELVNRGKYIFVNGVKL